MGTAKIHFPSTAVGLNLRFTQKIGTLVCSLTWMPVYLESCGFQMLSSESDKFGGDTLLSGQEALHQVHKMMDGWTDAALKVFNRHRQDDGNNYPDHDDMLRMNEVWIMFIVVNIIFIIDTVYT